MSAETILVVDDSRDNREFIAEHVLEPNGYKILMAPNGRVGLELALKHHPDLILLDYSMPQMDGAGVLRALAEHHMDIPVILMTFHGSENLAVEVFRLGVRDYIPKPFYPEDMERAIARALAETRLHREKDALTQRLISANRDLQARLQELNVLYNIGKNVASLIDMDVLMTRVVEAAVQIAHAEEGSIYLFDSKKLICRARKTSKMAHPAAEHSEAENTIALHTFKMGQSITLKAEELENMHTNATAATYVPLILGEKAIGVLGVENVSARGHTFTNHETALLSALGDYATIAIANSHNYEELRRTKEKEKERIRGTFERFVAPSVVNQVLQKPETLQLGGHRKEISVLFADIRGYTRWSEDAPPEQVVEVLNHYLSMAAEVVLAWEGTLDKFFGDGLMAIFNAPDDQTDHVHRAADAALALIRAADEVSAIHGHKLSYSVGVHVGEAVVGYIGTDRAVNYTAIGDTVNLTKRLQEYAAPGQILVEETVIQRLGALAQARPLGEMKVKGRKKAAFVYELSGLHYPNPTEAE